MHATSNAHIDNGSKPCLCRNCVYKSKPESSRDDLLHGSRIDKLYYDKYLPLREKKLIEKLVRTRAVYDDIRNRILESDTDSNENCGCVNKRKVINARDSYPVHEIVSLVDRGELSSLNSSINPHSKCCLCCDCKPKATKQPKVHRHIPSLEDVEDYLSTHEGKKIKSDSCLCTLQLSTEKNRLKYESKHLKPILKAEKTTKVYQKKNKKEYNNCKCFKKLQSIISIKHAVNEIVQSSIPIMGNKFRNLKKDSIQLYKEQKKYGPLDDWACATDFCSPGRCKLADCYKELQKRLPDLDHKRKIRFADEKVQTVKETSPKRKRKRKAQKIVCDCKQSNIIKSAASMTNVSVAKTTSTNKSSTRTKSASSTQRQKPHKRRGRVAISNKPLPFPRECDPGMCEPGNCNPKDCAKILLKSSQGAHHLDRCSCTQLKTKKEPKAKKPKKTPKPKVEEINSDYKSTASSTSLFVVKTTTTNKSSVATKATSSADKRKLRKNRVGVSKPLPFPRECDPDMCEPGLCNPKECAKILLRNSQAAHNLDRCHCTQQIKKRPKKEPPETSSIECMCSIKQKKEVEKIIKETATQPKKKEKVTRKTTPAAYKVQSVQKNIDRCFCTLDLKKTIGKERIMPKVDDCACENTSSISTQSLKRKPVRKKTKITSASVPKATRRNVQTRVPKHRKPSKPAVEPDKEDYSPKSRSSPDAPARQMVRISSSFRFDIEFFKENNYPDTNMVAPKTKTTTETKKKKPRTPQKKTKATKPKVEPLKRCMCTLELHKKTTKKSGPKKVIKYESDVSSKSKSSITCDCKRHVLKKLLPYECEPDFCSPDQCDPYVCEKRIKMRSSTVTNTDSIPSTTHSTTTLNSSSKAITCKCSDSKVKSSTKKANLLAKCFCTKSLREKQKRCFCTRNLYEKQSLIVIKKVPKEKTVVYTQTKWIPPITPVDESASDPIQSVELLKKSKQPKHKSLVQKCLCKLHIKHKKDIPVEARTTETQTAKVNHKKDKEIRVHPKCQCIKPKEPKRPKQKTASCYSSGFDETLESSTDIQPCRTKKRNGKCGCADSGDSLPSSSPSKAVRIGSKISFCIEFYRNKKQPKKKRDKSRGSSANIMTSNNVVRNRGDAANIGYVHVTRGNLENSGLKLQVKSRMQRRLEQVDSDYYEPPYRDRGRR